jgi:hypothetical protein
MQHIAGMLLMSVVIALWLWIVLHSWGNGDHVVR